MIQSKKQPVIKKGTTVSYNPDTFTSPEFFFEVDDPQIILDNLKPFELNGRKFITFDTETHPTDLSAHDIPKNVVRRWVGSGKTAKPQDFPFCISICDGTNCYTMYDNYETGFEKMKKLQVLFDDVSIEKIAHNAKFDMHELANAGITINGKIHDTVVLTKIINENRKSFELRKLASQYGGIDTYEYMVDAYKKAYKIVDYRHIPKQLLTAYANADVWNCFKVFTKDFLLLEKEELTQLYETELNLMLALWAMERYGMKVDENYEQPLKDELQKLADEAEQTIYDTAGTVFNINSSPQLYSVLVNLNVDPLIIPKTDKGNPKLDKYVLADLADIHNVEIVKHILTYRKYEKLLTTYAVGIYSQRNTEFSVHGSINQTEATTGRMSITKPALQTLPKKDKRIRTAFIPRDGYDLYMMDLDQIEYRLFAHYAQAKGLIQAIIDGKDVHQATAELIYKIPYDSVNDLQRDKAKTVNFSLIYGQGDSASASSLKMTVSEARLFKNNYFAQIPEAAPFIYTVKEVVKTRGFVKNLYGRRRRLEYSECYKAPNALIQSCAADYIKKKIVEIFKFLMYNKCKTRMINVVHDEIIFELHKDEQHLVPILRYMLSDLDTFRVPITAGVEKGTPSWGLKAPVDDVPFIKPDSYDIDMHSANISRTILDSI